MLVYSKWGTIEGLKGLNIHWRLCLVKGRRSNIRVRHFDDPR